MQALPISFCIFVKDEAASMRDCIESIRPVVTEIIVVDTGSTDDTVAIAKRYTDNVYQVGFTDFGSIRTLTAHLANQPWILMLDADERIMQEDWPKFAELINQPVGTHDTKFEKDPDGNVVIDSWALPRKRWADKWMTTQVDTASYPDWQVRLFRNHTERRRIKFVRRVHETVNGCIRTENSDKGPVIHHFQNLYKDKDKLTARQILYTKLYEADLKDGVEHSEPPVVEEDKV